MFSSTKSGRAAAAAAVDPNFPNVTLLLHGDGANGAQNNTFVDSSTNNFTITRNGNATQGSLSPYGNNWSNYFDGSGDYFTVADNVALQMGSGDFTIEFWINFNSLTGYQTPIDKGYTQAGGLLFQTGDGNGRFVVYAGGSAVITETGTATAGQWIHYALVRSGTTLTLYRDGVSSGTATNSTNFNNTGLLGIGANGTAPAGGSIGQYPINGYLSNVRFVKGTAVYTTNFTPSTTPLTAITNTALLTCQSNRFRDASSNNFTITHTGDVSVQRFSPFAPTAAYSPATIGGSGYFDGAGGYLTTPANTAFVLGTGDFTVEAWVYRTALSSTFAAIATNWTTGWWFGFNNNQLTLLRSGGTTVLTNTSTTPVGSWFHCAVCRQSGTTRLFVNGAQVASAADTNDYSGSNAIFVGQADANNHPYTGYISNLRIVKGTAVYTANFTPPTAPVTAITNTSLLLNFTNGAIFDNAMTNDLVTAGSAQVSTAQKKYGTGSMYFTGTSYLSITPDMAGQSLNFGSGDFTIEWWMYSTAVGGNQYIFDWRGSVTGAQIIAYQSSTTAIDFYVGTLSTVTIGDYLNMWAHIAIVKSGTTVTVYRDGVAKGSWTPATSFPKSGMILGQRYLIDGVNFAGYIDDFRVTKGVARYLANFTPPTAAFFDQ